jgi:integrase
MFRGWALPNPLSDDGSLDRRHRSGKTAGEVERKINALETKRDAGHVPGKGRAPTVEEWMTTYLDTIALPSLAPRTYDDYWSKTRNWIIPGLGKHRLDRLQPEHLDRLYAKMTAAGKAPSHVLKVHRNLSRALKVALRRGYVARNVATITDAPSVTEVEIEPFTEEETRRILAAAEKRRNPARWSIGLALGLRRGEVLGLRWAYVDLDKGLLRVWWQLQRTSWRHGCRPESVRVAERQERPDAAQDQALPQGMQAPQTRLPAALSTELCGAREYLPETPGWRAGIPSPEGEVQAHGRNPARTGDDPHGASCRATP